MSFLHHGKLRTASLCVIPSYCHILYASLELWKFVKRRNGNGICEHCPQNAFLGERLVHNVCLDLLILYNCCSLIVTEALFELGVEEFANSFFNISILNACILIID